MSRLALFLLGSPRIERDGEPVHIPRRKAVALLAYLAVTGQTHRRDALATLLWPEHDQSHARAGLRRALSPDHTAPLRRRDRRGHGCRCKGQSTRTSARLGLGWLRAWLGRRTGLMDC